MPRHPLSVRERALERGSLEELMSETLLILSRHCALLPPPPPVPGQGWIRGIAELKFARLSRASTNSFSKAEPRIRPILYVLYFGQWNHLTEFLKSPLYFRTIHFLLTHAHTGAAISPHLPSGSPLLHCPQCTPRTLRG